MTANAVANCLWCCGSATMDRVTQADHDAVRLVVVPEVDGALGLEWDAVDVAVDTTHAREVEAVVSGWTDRVAQAESSAVYEGRLEVGSE